MTRKKSVFIVALILFFLLLAFFSSRAIFSHFYQTKTDKIRLISFDPPLPAVIKVGEPLTIKCEYEFHSSTSGGAGVSFFYKSGKQIQMYADRYDSPNINTGSGTFSIEVKFTQPILIDKAEIYIYKTDTWSLIKRHWSTALSNVTCQLPLEASIEVLDR